MLRVDCTNDIVGDLLVIVCGLLGRLRCHYVLPRYDLTDLARAGALAHGLRCCSSMSGLPRLCRFVIGMFVAVLKA